MLQRPVQASLVIAVTVSCVTVVAGAGGPAEQATLVSRLAGEHERVCDERAVGRVDRDDLTLDGGGVDAYTESAGFAAIAVSASAGSPANRAENRWLAAKSPIVACLLPSTVNVVLPFVVIVTWVAGRDIGMTLPWWIPGGVRT
jgi:hypothetical protein